MAGGRCHFDERPVLRHTARPRAWEKWQAVRRGIVRGERLAIVRGMAGGQCVRKKENDERPVLRAWHVRGNARPSACVG